jgi:hypothetical protein
MDDQRVDRTGGGMSEVMIHDSFPRFRFGVMTLLVITALLAVALGSYLSGRANGYKAGHDDGWHAAKSVERDRL